MRAARYFAAVDSHTEGMPTRVVTGGVGPVPGATMLERKLHFERHMDDLRLLLMREPRGHGAMSGAILQPPTVPDADWGVVFIEVSGCLPMCGHGTIGVATVLVETGMVEVREPETMIRLDTPAGLVEARVAVADGRARSVTLRNVPSFLLGRDRTVALDGRTISYDMAFGGNFYAIMTAESAGVAVDPTRADELIERGLAAMDAINASDPPVHPEDDRIAVRDRHVGQAGGAPRSGRARRRGRIRQRVGDRHEVRGPDRGGDGSRRPVRDRAGDHRARLDHRDGPVHARPRGSVSGGVRALTTPSGLTPTLGANPDRVLRSVNPG